MDLDLIEEAIKLAVKYQLQELVLPDGTKITKTIHLGKPLPKKKETNKPISTFNPSETLYLTTPAPPLTLDVFNRFGKIGS